MRNFFRAVFIVVQKCFASRVCKETIAQWHDRGEYKQQQQRRAWVGRRAGVMVN